MNCEKFLDSQSHNKSDWVGKAPTKPFMKGRRVLVDTITWNWCMEPSLCLTKCFCHCLWIVPKKNAGNNIVGRMLIHIKNNKYKVHPSEDWEKGKVAVGTIRLVSIGLAHNNRHRSWWRPPKGWWRVKIFFVYMFDKPIMPDQEYIWLASFAPIFGPCKFTNLLWLIQKDFALGIDVEIRYRQLIVELEKIWDTLTFTAIFGLIKWDPTQFPKFSRCS